MPDEFDFGGGPVAGAETRDDAPPVNAQGLVVRVVGGVVVIGPLVVDQGTSPWIVYDPTVDATLLTIRDTAGIKQIVDPVTVLQGGAWVVDQGTSPWVISGLVGASQIGAWTVTCNQGTSPWVVSGAVTISGNVTVDQGTSPWVVHDASFDVLLSTRASEATLATRLADATFTARINTLGQKTMANSTPVVIASDQSAIPITDTTTGTLNSGVETVVGAAAVSVLAAGVRKVAIIQNTGVANIRIGDAAVTATTGVRLTPGSIATLDGVTSAIFAIREGAISSIVLGQDIT